MIKRQLLKIILSNIRPGFVNIIYGARRVGKTVLLDQIKQSFPQDKIISFNGDLEETREAWKTSSEVKLDGLVGAYNLIIIDEAQRIENIGLSLKIIVDKYPSKKIFVSGSSSLEMTRGVRESLTGRNKSYILYPFSTSELSFGLDDYKKSSLLDDQLINGAYPYLSNLTLPSEKQDYLRSIVDDYLFRDILLLERIDNPETLKKLASLLAFQIGSEVSLNELSNNLDLSVKTVARYISLLEKSFVIFGVGAYANNLCKEISKSKKYYFFDLGIRNALISQFLPLASRTDTGALWENFLFVERRKKQEYSGVFSQTFFWRNYQRAEIDMIELRDNKISAFEFKWSKKRAGTPKQFKDTYKTEAQIIDRDNYIDFVC